VGENMKLLAIFGVFAILLFAGCSGSSSTGSANKAQTQKSGTITYTQYQQLETGMSYKEVVAILGREGKLSSSSSIAGYDTDMYTWSNPFGGTVICMFQQEVLMSKSQSGLN
jgi:hypothetical protein